MRRPIIKRQFIHYFEHIPDIQEILELAPDAKCCLFDMDGTIINTEILHARSIHLTLKIPSMEVSEVHAMCLGRNDSGIFQELLAKELAQGDLSSLLELKNKHYLEILSSTESADIFLPQMELLMKSLKSHGIKLGLVTSSDLRSAKSSMDKLGLLYLFDVVVAEETTDNHKPHPEPYQHACQILGLSPSECVVFEDSPTGLEAARQFGPKTIIRAGWY